MRKGLFLSFLCAGVLYAGGDIVPPMEPVVEAPVAADVNDDAVEQGAPNPYGYNAALKVGTLGVGLDISRALNDGVALRLNVNGLKINRTETLDDVDYDASLKLLTAGLLADYYPFENGFRLSAGAYYNGNKLDGTATPADTQSVKIGDQTFTGAQLGHLDAKVDFKKFAPYLGIGWGNDSRRKGWGFTFDLGVLYQGSPKVYAKGYVDANAPGKAALQTQIDTEVEKERQNIANDIDNYKWYPVVMIGINYTF